MKSLTITSSKGGIGKSLLTANIGATLAACGKKTILVEADPTNPLQLILGTRLKQNCLKLEDVVEKNCEIEQSVYLTKIHDLFLLPSGISLEDYYSLKAIKYAQKLQELDADYLLIDVPSPLGEAAFLSLGFCQYFLVLLSEEDIWLSVEAAIDTVHLGKSHLNCLPLGFIINKVAEKTRINEDFVKKIEQILSLPCIAKIAYSKIVAESFGLGSQKPFLAYEKFSEGDFCENMENISRILLGDLPKPIKKDPVLFLEKLTK
jgi:septum site-determining protein MinD